MLHTNFVSVCVWIAMIRIVIKLWSFELSIKNYFISIQMQKKYFSFSLVNLDLNCQSQMDLEWIE